MFYAHGYKPFFVRTAIARIVSLLYVMEDGSSAEIAVVGNRHHSVEQQLCRWLLLSLDRLPLNELTMTQELIANMLGVRREGVTEAAGNLQAAGLIPYRRGKIKEQPDLQSRRNLCRHDPADYRLINGWSQACGHSRVCATAAVNRW